MLAKAGILPNTPVWQKFRQKTQRQPREHSSNCVMPACF